LVFVCVRAAKMTIGIANLPNQKHRKVAKQGARLNMLIVGPCAHTAVHPE
jgi:septin family protein